MYLTRRDLHYLLLSVVTNTISVTLRWDTRWKVEIYRSSKWQVDPGSIRSLSLSLSLFQCCIWILASTVRPTEIQHWRREEGTSVPTNVTLVVFAIEKQRLYEVVIIMKGPVEKGHKWWLQVENLNCCYLAERWHTGWFSCKEHCCAVISWPDSFNLKN